MTAKKNIEYRFYNLCYLEDGTFQEWDLTLEGKQNNTIFSSGFNGWFWPEYLHAAVSFLSFHFSVPPFFHTHAGVGTQDILLLFIYYFASDGFYFWSYQH